MHYAPPEVLEGSPATPISDVYSFAATLYTLLEGTRPFAAAGGHPPVGRRAGPADHARGAAAGPARPTCPASLAELLARTMAKRPEQRPPSAAEFGQELQRIQGELGPAGHRRCRWPRRSRRARSRRRSAARGRRRAVRRRAPVRRTRRRCPRRAPAADGPAAAAIRSSRCATSTPGDDDDDDHDHGHTVTIGRAGGAGRRADERDGGEATTRRVVLGTVAGVVCLLAVAVSLLVFGRGGGDGSSPTTTGPTTTQLIELKPPQPQGVTVAPAAEPGTGRRRLAGRRRAG